MSVTMADATDRVEYGDIAAISGLTGITVAYTILPSGSIDATARVFQQWTNVGGAEQAFVCGITDTNELGWLVGNNGAGGFFGRKTTDLDIVVDTLYRFCLTWDAGGGGSMKVWVNGVSRNIVENVGSVNIVTIQNSPAQVALGHETVQGRNPLVGDYSELAIWNHAVPDWVAKAYGEGFSPSFYRTGGILYDRLLGTNSFNEWGADEPVHTGTVKAAHPSIIVPVAPSHVGFVAAAAVYLPLDQAHTPQHQTLMAS